MSFLVCLALLVSLPLSASAAPSDAQAAEWHALGQLYSATGGDGWLSADGWRDAFGAGAGGRQAGTVCGNGTAPWFGVTCTPDGRVAALDLSGNLLAGTLPGAGWGAGLDLLARLSITNNALGGPPAFDGWQLAALERLELFNNRLSGTFPAAVAGLPALTFLDVSDNRLSGTVASHYSGYDALQYLSLHANHVSGTLPADYQGLAGVSVLSLSTNALSGTLPGTVTGLGELTELHLYENLLSGELGSVAGIPKLELLKVAENFLSGTWPERWSPHLESLASIDASFNLISGHVPKLCEGLPRLRSLSLWGCRISGELHGLYDGFLGLSQLVLGANSISGALRSKIFGLPSLSLLQLESNLISGDLPGEWEGVPALSELHLASNRLENFPSTWSGVNHLVTLHVGNNSLGGTITSLNGLESLENLNLAHNADLSDCMGPVLPNLPALRSLTLHGCKADSGADDGHGQLCRTHFLPMLVESSESLRSFSDSGLVCPQWLSLPPARLAIGGYINSDAEYLRYERCFCRGDGSMWSWDSLQCQPCPLGVDEGLACSPYVLNPTHCVSGNHYPRAPGGGLVALQRDLPTALVVPCRKPGLCNAGPGGATCGMHSARGRRDDDGDHDGDNAADHTNVEDQNPWALEFRCAAGHDEKSMLCSRCLRDHWPSGGTCLPCHDSFVVVVPAVLAVTLAALVLYLWRKSGRPDDPLRTFSTALLWLQLEALLEASSEVHGNNSGSTTWAWVTHVRGALASWAVARPWAVQCLDGGLDYVSAGLTVLAAPALIAAVGAAAALALRRGGPARARALYVTGYALLSLYLPVATVAMSAFNCEVAGGVRFLSAAPYVTCSMGGNRRFAAFRACAVASLLTYVLPLPVVCYYAVRRYQRMRGDAGGPVGYRGAGKPPKPQLGEPLLPVELQYLHNLPGGGGGGGGGGAAGSDTDDDYDDTDDSFLGGGGGGGGAGEFSAASRRAALAAMVVARANMTERLLLVSLRDPRALWWWPVVYELGRKLVLAMIVGLLPVESPLLPVFVFVALFVMALAHIQTRPWRHSRDNSLETLVLGAALSVYLLNIVGGTASERDGGGGGGGSDATLALVSLAHAGMIVVLALALYSSSALPAFLQRAKTSRRARRRHRQRLRQAALRAAAEESASAAAPASEYAAPDADGSFADASSLGAASSGALSSLAQSSSA